MNYLSVYYPNGIADDNALKTPGQLCWEALRYESWEILSHQHKYNWQDFAITQDGMELYLKAKDVFKTPKTYRVINKKHDTNTNT